VRKTAVGNPPPSYYSIKLPYRPLWKSIEKTEANGSNDTSLTSPSVFYLERLVPDKVR